MNTGKVKFFNAEKGYGFIINEENDKEVFFHVTKISRSNTGEFLKDTKVEFSIENGPKGVQATNVKTV